MASAIIGERWLPVPGYEGRYEVSDFGHVRSVARIVRGRNKGTRLSPSKVLKHHVREGGSVPYVHITLWNGEKFECRFIHTLVLTAFVGPCPAGMQCRHGPTGSLDNRLENLMWGTALENSADKVRDGTDSRGTRNGRAKLDWTEVSEIRASRRQIKDLAEQYGVSTTTIFRVRRGSTWAT